MKILDLKETYHQNNSQLLRYLKGREFDPYRAWDLVAKWLYDHDFNPEGLSLEELKDVEDPELFYGLSDSDRQQCEEWVIDYLHSNRSYHAPSWSFLDPDDKLVNRNTWLVHFTNDPFEIQKDGFIYGVSDMDELGLTTSFSMSYKENGGYNFAFIAGSRYIDPNKYGKHAVMFKSSGVKAWHYGDEEYQVIFWGPSVNPKDIVVIYNVDGDWVIEGDKRALVKLDGFKRAEQWVMTNFDQYRKQITRR